MTPLKKFVTKSADGKNEKVKESNVCTVSSLMFEFDSLVVNVLFFFVLPAQISQSHDHSSKSWEFFLGVLKHGAG